MRISLVGGSPPTVPPVVLAERANAPVAVLPSAVLFRSAPVPTAVLSEPVVLSNNAAAPTPVLSAPLLRTSAPTPKALLKLPSILAHRDRQPKAVFPAPVVSEMSVSSPSNVLKLLPQPSLQIARAPGKSAKQANTGRMTINIVLRFFMI